MTGKAGTTIENYWQYSVTLGAAAAFDDALREARSVLDVNDKVQRAQLLGLAGQLLELRRELYAYECDHPELAELADTGRRCEMLCEIALKAERWSDAENLLGVLAETNAYAYFRLRRCQLATLEERLNKWR